jgi:hypothetical protein
VDWRKLHNEKLHNLYSLYTNTKAVDLRKRCIRIQETSNAQKILVEK